MILGLDVSHFQGNPNMAAIKAAGRDFIAIKATEGVGYVDATFTANRKAAHAAGLIVGIYHFGRDNTPAAEAAYFAGVVGALQPGEFLVLDQEIAHVSGNVAWCQAWLDATRARYGIAPLVYMNVSSNTGTASGNWTQVAATYGLWLAKYDNAPATQNAVPYWGVPAMKQYSDAGSVLGISGTCDVDSFFGTADQLLAYAYQGSSTMALSTADIDAIWNYPINGVRARDRVEGVDRIQLPAIASAVKDIHGKVVDAQLDLTGRPQDRADDLLGHVLSTEARVKALAAAPSAAVSVDPAALAAALLANPTAVAALGDAIAAGLAKRVGNG